MLIYALSYEDVFIIFIILIIISFNSHYFQLNYFLPSLIQVLEILCLIFKYIYNF